MKTPVLLALPALFLSACASLSGPSPEDIARLPVVRYGESAPADGNFVLLYPAGVDLPVVATVDGDLFAKTDTAQLQVRLKQDVYTYRNRVSFDGRTWSSGTSKVTGKFGFSLPGEKDGKVDAQSPGEMSARFHYK